MRNVVTFLRELPIDWTTFGTATILLLLPFPLFFGKSVHYREIDRPWRHYVPAVLTLPWHWADLVRSVAGVWLLREAVGLTWFVREPLGSKWALALMGAVLCIAILVQTIACKLPDSFHAAFAPVVGLLVALFPPIVSGLALIAAIMGAMAFRSAVAFFGAASIAIAVAGFPFFPKWPALAAGAAACLVPLLLPVMFHRDLVIGHRKLSPE